MLSASLFGYLFFVRRKPATNSPVAQAHAHAHTHTAGLLLLLFLSCFQVHSHLAPPTVAPRLPRPRCVSTCTSLLRSLLALLKCETAPNPNPPTPFLFGPRWWLGVWGQIRSPETEAEVRSALVITAQRDGSEIFDPDQLQSAACYTQKATAGQFTDKPVARMTAARAH